MAHRAAPISVSIALGHASANALKAIAGGWTTGSSASLTFPLHSHMSSARREGSEYHFKSLWYDSAGTGTHDLPVVRQTLYHWVITLVSLFTCTYLFSYVLFIATRMLCNSTLPVVSFCICVVCNYLYK